MEVRKRGISAVSPFCRLQIKGEIIMDELQNEEVKAEPRRRRKPKKSALPFPVPAFFSRIGEDVKWYYDVRLWSPLILLLLILALIPSCSKSEAPEATEPTAIIETEPVPETEPTQEPIIPEAAALAKLADSVGAGRSDNVKTVIMWVAINRSEAGGVNGYGQSVIEEIARPSQWQGYDENVEYSAHTYEIAKSVLETQKNGGLRPLDSDMFWLVLNDNGSVTVRNQFTATGNQKWREKTVK